MTLSPFGVCKTHKNPKESLLFSFLVYKFFLEHTGTVFLSKKWLEETWPKIYLGQDSDPDVFKSLIRIRSNIVRIRNIAWGYLHDYFGII
jgi:hypothetical protein